MAGEVQRKGFGYFLFGCVLAAILYGIWLGYKRWQTVRQFQIMEQHNAQIDSVLEDIDPDDSASIDELEFAIGSDEVDEQNEFDGDVELDNMKPSSSRSRLSVDGQPTTTRVEAEGSDIL